MLEPLTVPYLKLSESPANLEPRNQLVQSQARWG